MVSLPHPSTPDRRPPLLAWILIAVVPVLHIAINAVVHSRNIVFWDEFDTALDLVLQLDKGSGWRDLAERLLAVNSDHRMVTSRLLFALNYWLTGTINFHVIGAIGNLFLLAACVLLLVTAGTRPRRIRLGVVLAFLLFQLEHFENFFWSGASIDHFQVPMLAVGAIVATVRGSGRALVLAGALALAATFTLAHGTLVWPVCGLLLLAARRWRHFAFWLLAAALAAAAFLHGFEIDPGHRIGEPLAKAAAVLRYWLALLGAPLTLADAGFGPYPGAALLAILGTLAARGAFRREPVAGAVALFAVGSLGLVAIGRVEVADEAVINSRYLVLGALAWAMAIWTLLELHATPARPFRALLWCLPALAAFNVAANLRFAPLVTSYIEVRDRAATAFKQHGVDGRGIVRLHPRDGHADRLLQEAEDRGIYRLPPVTHFVSFPDPRPSDRIVAHVDQLLVTPRAITIGGWGMIPDITSRRGQVHVVLRSEKSFLVLTTVMLQRPDVARAYGEPRWHRSGFRAVLRPNRLPKEDFEVGVLLDLGSTAEFTMTKHRVLLSSDPPGRHYEPFVP